MPHAQPLTITRDQKYNQYPKNKTIHQLFEEQVNRTPDNVALVFQNTKITYKELNNQANRLARFIKQEYDIKPEQPIALCLDRNENIVISILAILKVGGCYVPLDPSYPDERIKYILKDVETNIIITNSIYKNRFNKFGFKKNSIAVDSQFQKKQFQKFSPENLGLMNEPQSLAYIIYTSGTTGFPKGVLQTHGNVMRLFTSTNDWYDFNSQDTWTLFHSYIFDFSVWEIWGALFYGGKIIVVSYEETRDFEKFYNLCKKENVTVLNQTPTAFYQFINIAIHQDNNKKLSNLRYVIFGGESLNLQQLIPWFTIYGYQKPKLINMYGITELTVHVTYKPIEKKDIGKHSYIGQVLPDLTAYILNSSLQPVPIGGIGELHIGGMGLARGYLNQPELTAEKFIGNPFQSEEEKISGRNDRLYKTGDLVRWLSDGNIEYIGRNDFQVKIRGHRIELGEIESLLSTYEGIKQSVVVAKNHESTDGKGHLYLGGYYVSDHPLNEDEIRSYLHSQLPDYMVPTFLMWVASLPLTINGKLDRKALPTPELSHQETYIAPRSEEERKICSIWGEVLGLSSQVGIRDDFFRLGGDSIMAIKLVNKLNKEFDKKFSILGILKSRTIENLTSYLDNNHQNMTIYKTDIAHPENQTLSFAQERLWFIEKYEEGTNAYNLPMVFLLLPTTNLTTLKTSIQAIVQRHEILRTVIKESSEGSGYQFVLNDTDNFLEIKTVYVTSQEQLNETINSEVNHIYDLKTEHPIRVSFYELNDLLTGKKENYLSIVVHHIAFDGWSVDIFWKELHAYYDYYTRQQEGAIAHLNLPELTIQYKDFALWQRDYLSGERLQEQLDYWLKQLEDYENLNLVTDLVRPKDIDYRGHNICFEIDQETSSDLRLLAKSLGVSLYSVLLGGYAIMLKAYSNQQDIVIGTPVANRHYPQVEHLIGFLVNSLALRIKIDDQLSIRDYIKQVGEIVVQAQLHQDLPFEKLVEQLDLEKNTSQHPIFQVMFEVQNFGGAKNTFLSPYKADFSTAAHFDISTSVDDSQDCITGVFNYAISLYEEGTIKRFIQTYKNILKQLTKSKTNKIADLNYLEPPHYQKIIYDWNATHKEYFIDKTIDQLFEEQVDKIPDHIAVVHNSIRLTYRTLNEKSNQLAHYLRENYNIKPESPFAFCLDKSPSMIVVILAILKAGGAYVPIDPECPDERIQYILKDTGSQLLITSESYMDRFNNIRRSSAHNFSALAIDSNDFQEQLDKQFIVNPKRISSNKNLVYIVYTSGTTGHPKGVMIGHKSLVTTYLGWELKYGLKDITNHLQMAGSSFDVFSGDFVRALLSGGKLILCSKQVLLRPEKLHQLIVDEHVEIAEFVPAVLNNLVDYLEDNRIKLDGIKLLISGSDCLLKKDYLRIRNICSSGARIINSYGLTETVIDSLYFEQTALDFLNESLPIGCPLPDTAVYVLDNQLRPLPVGAIGELYIGGDRLARGYLNRPELTAEKFIANPFQNEEEKISGYNDRLYKTGDLVRWLPDGNIEYIGRNDFQVKIRGHRIELGEIESVLSAFEGVKQCIVVAKNQESTNDNGHRHLVGYYVCDHPLNEDDIRNYLQSQLPDYMVPTVLIHLKELPLNLNGKIDRKALPVPGFTSTQTYVAPRNEIESKLCAIWADVLGLSYDKVGIKDGFFRLGGNSILVIKLINEINKKLDSNLKISVVFEHNTVDKIGSYLKTTIDQNEKGKRYVF